MTEGVRPPSLGPLEAKITRVAWDHDRFMPVREMVELLDERLAYTTVMTVNERAVREGAAAPAS